MYRIDLCGQIGVKISSYGDTQFIKINPLNRPWGRFLPREDSTWNYHSTTTQKDHNKSTTTKQITVYSSSIA